jgi:carbamoyl-phosphate synthase/aspartate carbamoyltransferase/dihydroorotase
MKSVGEVMAIGRTFQEAFQKSLRMLDIGADGFEGGPHSATDDALANPTDTRMLVLAAALEDGYTVDRLYDLTKIDKWFLSHCKAIIDLGKHLRTATLASLSKAELLLAKQSGFSDRQIGVHVSSNELAVRKLRQSFGLRPRVKQIDTVAAEYPAMTNYLYLTYHGTDDDVEFSSGYTMVLGSGVYRIGSSVEFDYCAVGCVRELRRLGKKTIMLNYNPETVSTDYDECDRLYFEQLTFETVMDVYEVEKALGVVLAMGGQIPNNMAIDLQRQHCNIFGTSADMIDGAENRFKFSRMCDNNSIDQPKWKELTNVEEAHEFCSGVTYPCLMRPSYILSGVGMRVVHDRAQLEQCFKAAKVVSRDYPVVISKFIMGAKEIEVDAVAENGRMIVSCISEHVENAGIHSGDATIIHPPQDLTDKTIRGVKAIAAKIARALKINGPFNIQFIAKDDTLKVIETNVRVSRSFPFVSKTTGIDMIAVATRVMIGVDPDVPTTRRGVIGVKVPQFSFPRLAGADPTLGVDMISTGEVACFGETVEEAYLKALQATKFKLPPLGSNVLLSIGSFSGKTEFAPSVKLLADLGYILYGSPGTADYYQSLNGVAITSLDWIIDDEEQPDIQGQLAEGKFALVINLPTRSGRKARQTTGDTRTDGAATRRGAVDYNIPLVTDIKCAKLLIRAIRMLGVEPMVSSIDCTYSREIVKLPSFIATAVQVVDPATDTANALAAGFGTICVFTKSTQTAQVRSLVDMASADVALILSTEEGGYMNKGMRSPSRRTTSRASSVSSENDAPTPIAYSANLADTADVDFATIMNVAENLPEDALLCIDASDTQLATVLLFGVLYDKRIHVQSITSATEMKMVVAAKKKGFGVTCGVSLSSMFGDDGNSELWGFVEDIDVVSIQHSASSSQMDIAIPLLFGAVDSGKCSLEQVVAWLSTNPAAIFGIDFVTEDSSSYVEVDIEYDHEQYGSPVYDRISKDPVFAGCRLKGRVSRTIVRGELAYVDGKVFAAPGFGKCISTTSGKAAKPASATKQPASDNSNSVFRSLNDSSPVPDPDVKLTSLAKLDTVKVSMKNTSVLSVTQFTRDMLKVLFDFAHQMHIGPPVDLLKGTVMAAIFYEPSTRTSCSFTAAMMRLGGTVINLNQMSSTSVSKGESLGDFIRTMECYTDVIVLRHPEKGSVEKAAGVSSVAVINAGDGTGEHPTQALLDVFTIREELGTVNGLNITLLGDLKHGRTVHSLARLLALYNVSISYVAPKGLEMPQAIIDDLTALGVKQTFHTNVDDVIATTDVLYVTRLQKERLPEGLDATTIGEYVVDAHLLSQAKEKMIVMHPLPRVDEIHTEVDTDPRAAYFRQMEYGMYVRMALLALVMGKSSF